MRRFYFLAISGILLLALMPLFPSHSAAQIFNIETILESDGLTSPDIKSITQDRWGFMWVSSRNGLVHHNGLTWEKANLDSIASSPLDGLLDIGAQGHVWALFSGKAPTLISKTFQGWATHDLPDDLARSYQTFSHLTLAVQGEETVAAVAKRSNVLYVSSSDGWQQIPLEEYGIDLLLDIVAMDENFILLTNKGIFKIPVANPTDLQPLMDTPLPSPERCLCVNQQDNSLWIVGDDWIGKYFQGNFAYLYPPQGKVFSSFTDAYAKTCQTDGYGGIYISGNFSTEYLNPQIEPEPLGPRNSLVEFGTTAFFLDRERVLWQGTTQGIHKVISKHTSGFNRQQGLLSDEVTALLHRRDGTILMGHNHGLTLLGDQMTKLEFPEIDLRDRVLDLAEDSQGNVWIAGRQRGLGRLSPNGSLRWWPLGKGLLTQYISSVLVDEQDRVWIASGAKVLIWQDGEFTDFSILPYVQGNGYVRRLINGRDGTIYAATGNDGVLAIKDGQIQQWTTGLRDQGNSIYDILETPEAMTWVGTRNGLYQLAGNRLTRPIETHLQINRPVYFLETDNLDRLWLGTDNGVIRVDGTQTKHLTVESGVLGRETNRCASLLDGKGRFWMGTERGLTIFNDIFENTNPQPPLAYLMTMESEGQSHTTFPSRGEITLPAHSTNLAFQYRVLTTAKPKRIKVLHRLDGVDNDWVEQSQMGESIIRYAHVPPGTYQFHIKAAGSDQPWSEVASSPQILIPSPFWQRSWFLVLMGIALLAVLALPIVFIAQQRYTLRLKKEVKQQVEANLRIEAELEQARNLKSLGLLAGGIAHDFNNLLTIIFGNLSLLRNDDNLQPAQQTRLNAATGAIERARGLTNQLLTFSKGGAPILQVGSLANLVRESAAFVLRGSKSQCRFKLPEDLWSVVMDSGQMNQVVNNLLMNATEAMPSGGTITLSGKNLTEAPPGLAPGVYVEITVKDNGPGIDPKHLPKIFAPYFSTKEHGSGLGLATAFSILDRHDGRLSVESTLGQGTTFQLLVPASNQDSGLEVQEPWNPSTHLEGNVLLLDDDPEVRHSMGQMLESLGMTVEAVAEGRLALEKYRQMLDQGHPPQLVIMDLTIPGGLGGKEIIAPLLAMDSQAKAIVISGYSHNPVLSEYRKHGFKAAIAKPILMPELGNVLRKVLAG